MKCPKCGKRSVYIRIRKGEGVCQRCGYTGEKREFEEKEVGIAWKYLNNNKDNSDILQELVKRRFKKSRDKIKN